MQLKIDTQVLQTFCKLCRNGLMNFLDYSSAEVVLLDFGGLEISPIFLLTLSNLGPKAEVALGVGVGIDLVFFMAPSYCFINSECRDHTNLVYVGTVPEWNPNKISGLEIFDNLESNGALLPGGTPPKPRIGKISGVASGDENQNWWTSN